MKLTRSLDLIAEKFTAVSDDSGNELPVVSTISPREAQAMLQRYSAIRGVMTARGGVLLWNAYAAIHDTVMDQLDVDEDIRFMVATDPRETREAQAIWGTKGYPTVGGAWLVADEDGAIPERLAKMFPPMVQEKHEEWKLTNGTEIEVFFNPSRQEFSRALSDSQYKILRGMLEYDGSLIVWDAALATHDHPEFGDGERIVLTAKGVYAYFDPEEENDEEIIDSIKNNKLISSYYNGNVQVYNYTQNPNVHINEKFVKDDYIPFLLNPTQRELIAFLQKSNEKRLRGLVSPNGDVYVWDAHLAIHDAARDHIDSNYEEMSSPKAYMVFSASRDGIDGGWPKHMVQYGPLWVGVYATKQISQWNYTGEFVDPHSIPEVARLIPRVMA